MVKRSRLSRSGGKLRESRLDKQTNIAELAEFAGNIFEDYDLRELREKALKRKFEEKHGTHLDEKYFEGTGSNLTISEQFKNIEEKVFGKHGSLDKLKLVQDYDNFRHYVGVRGSVLNGNKITKMINWRSVFVTLPVDPLYNFVHHVLKGEHLKDYHKVHTEFTEKQHEEYYKPDGVVKTDLFTMKRFQNGRVDVTFNDAASAKKVYDVLQEREAEWHKGAQW
jgi:hypothetical protein